MRFEDLHGLTSLPIEHIQHRFRNEEVISVLPGEGSARRPSLLVATPLKAAVVISESPAGEQWMTFWVPWDAVQIVDDFATDAGLFGLTLQIGRQSFVAEMSGPAGQKALRDFIVLVQSHRSAQPLR